MTPMPVIVLDFLRPVSLMGRSRNLTVSERSEQIEKLKERGLLPIVQKGRYTGVEAGYTFSTETRNECLVRRGGC